MGIDAIWIPPTIKNSGTNSVGYSPFDHYDLGEKYQKNSIKTRMGDKDELLRMMAVMKANGIDVIQDIVLNHVTNAGSSLGQGGQDPAAIDDGQTNRYKNFRYTCYKTPGINEAATNYLSREGRFPKNWQNFYPNNNNACCTNDINSPFWGPDVSYESNAFGLSSNAIYNPAQGTDYMRNGMRNWLIWYKKQMGWDGVRIDAVKHFPAYATEDFLWNLQNSALWASGGNDMYAVGEYVGNMGEIDNWCAAVKIGQGPLIFPYVLPYRMSLRRMGLTTSGIFLMRNSKIGEEQSRL
jgi:alpha-amylase